MEIARAIGRATRGANGRGAGSRRHALLAEKALIEDLGIGRGFVLELGSFQ